MSTGVDEAEPAVVLEPEAGRRPMAMPWDCMQLAKAWKAELPAAPPRPPKLPLGRRLAHAFWAFSRTPGCCGTPHLPHRTPSGPRVPVDGLGGVAPAAPGAPAPVPLPPAPPAEAAGRQGHRASGGSPR